ncbi:MAG: alpha/beta hydrolase [Reyranella sp.]|uniref:alpha/beta fold hydrolase n=1 Tax=Reyranella sp. TaxID=1929291 RepID=UPI00272FA19E|nr:alpha/beta hydrolase [Reyranella sp.]MDP1961620.1 alpha/beta hydrolase [Reyranella sp.]MDP2376812.1 alpha/beta hydrolase [Reyranella sp.]
MTDFKRLTAALDNNHGLQRRAALAALSLTVLSGEEATTVKIGARVVVSPGTAPDGAFSLAAPSANWVEFAKPIPAVGFQSLVGMQRMGHLKVAGDMVAWGRNLIFLEQLFAALRPDTPPQIPMLVGAPVIEPVIGRYLRLDFNGKPHRIYFEEAGEGIPLVCLHTAGADGRQYRALLNDTEITKRFRVVVFDLPWHGKSSPPPGFEREAYKLTTDLYVDTVMAVCRALKLDRPVVMGCSIGGRAVLHLSLRHGDYFRAAIGLQSATHAEAGADTRLRDLGVLFRPDVHGQEAAAGTVACLISPTSPNAEKWETLWHYMQGGPAVFMGDLHYYFTEGDLRNGLLDGLDTKRCPLHLLTGEYDLSATPALTAELARLVKATSFQVMEGLGHFPMSESPQQFRRYLLPVLQRIAG